MIMKFIHDFQFDPNFNLEIHVYHDKVIFFFAISALKKCL